MKRFAMIVLSAATMIGGVGVAMAQGHAHGGASFSGGSHVSGSGNGGGSWHGGGWHGGGNWHGSNWHGSHSRFVVGVGFAAPWWGWWPGYYAYAYPAYYAGYPYYYDYPYPYDYSGGYVEQGSSGSQSAPGTSSGQFSPGQYSYYCPDPAGYYPQVATCSKGWLRVVPQNAPGPSSPAPR